MQRIRFGRISAAVAALCLSGAIHHSDDISAMVNSVDTDGNPISGDVRVNMEEFGVIAGAMLPFTDGQFADLGPIKCTADVGLQRRVCSSRRPSESTFAASAKTHRSRSGAPQLTFDGMTTDTVVMQMALVKRGTDRGGHTTDLTRRSTQHWDGVAYASETMTLNGADTTYSAVHRASGINRFTGIVTYSDVRLVRHPSQIALDYPTGGVMYATETHELVRPESPRTIHSNVIVYFDGSRTPEAYIDGKPFRLDLQTGLARPIKVD